MNKASSPTNPWINLGVNILVPIILLGKGQSWLPFLPPWGVLVLALAFPIGWFLIEWFRQHRVNGFSIIGFISILLTGGIGLLKLSPAVFAIKETMVPLIFGVAIIGSLKTRRPLIKLLLYNPSVMAVDKVDAALDTVEKKQAFHRLIVQCTWIVAASFLVSAVLNYVITRIVVTTDPKINAAVFNEEIARQTGITFLVITLATLPLMIFAMVKLFKGIKSLTGLGLEDVIIDTKKGHVD